MGANLTMGNIAAAQQQPFDLGQYAQQYGQSAVYGNKALMGQAGQSMLPYYRAMMGQNRANLQAQLDTSGAQNVGEGVLKGLGNVIRLGQASGLRRQNEEDQASLGQMMQEEAMQREAMLRKYEESARTQFINNRGAVAAILPKDTPEQVLNLVAANPELLQKLGGIPLTSAETVAKADTGMGLVNKVMSMPIYVDAQGNKTNTAQALYSGNAQLVNLAINQMKAAGLNFEAPSATATGIETANQGRIKTASDANELSVQPTILNQKIEGTALDNKGKVIANDVAGLNRDALPNKLQQESDSRGLSIEAAKTTQDEKAALQAGRNRMNEALTKKYGPNWPSIPAAVEEWNANEQLMLGGTITAPKGVQEGQAFYGADGKFYVYQKGKNGEIKAVETDQGAVDPGVLAAAKASRPAVKVKQPLQPAYDSPIKLTPRKKTARDKTSDALMGQVGKTFDQMIAAPGRKLINSQAIFGSQKEAEMFIKRNNLKDATPREQKGSDGTSFGWKVY